jgi:hypothetical protein
MLVRRIARGIEVDPPYGSVVGPFSKGHIEGNGLNLLCVIPDTNVVER